MAHEFPPDIEGPAEVDDEYRQTVAAVREGPADMEAGRMLALRAILEEAYKTQFFEEE
jgi:hypothetical protein